MFQEYLLINAAFVGGKFDKTLLEAVKQLKKKDCSRGGDQRKVVNECMTKAALNCGLYFRELKKLAVISGAGIAGLAASFELRSRGFNVVIAEKRKEFSRFNVINLSVEVQDFLKKFNLLEKFENFIAPRITEHRIVIIGKDKVARGFAVSDVRGLQHDETESFDLKNINKMFNRDGIYSVPIKSLQTFLAENALEYGVRIFGQTRAKVIKQTNTGCVSKLQVADRFLNTHFFFISEGASSITALQMGMRTNQITNACTDEQWIFGNLSYSGKESFVVSIIDTSDKCLRLANVIFNARFQVINVAVTSEVDVSENRIREQILYTVQQVFDQKAYPIEKTDTKLITTVRKPVSITNRTRSPFSMGNVFCIGDSAGSSSPLAGLGGTLGLTYVPATIEQLIKDHAKQTEDLHRNFCAFSEGYTTRWIQKSEGIKKFCISVFDKEHSQN